MDNTSEVLGHSGSIPVSFPDSNKSTVTEQTPTSFVTNVTLAPTEDTYSHEIVFKFGISFVIFGGLFLAALAFIGAIWYVKRKARARNRQQSQEGYNYDNQVDILQHETSDTIALEKAFGTGVLVIQDSPIVRQRERLTKGTGTGPTNMMGGYMSTAESDTEHIAI